jgi:vitamin B12 transporter
MKKWILGAALSGALFAGIFAENTNTVFDAERIVVTATRTGTSIEQVGSSISVITAEEIEQQQSKNVYSAIQQIPGVQRAQEGGPGTVSSVYMRGANANHTLVLVNGMRVNSNTDGGFNLSTLPADAIERIEVLRGTQSALYGSDAIGGVINIITKKGFSKPIGGSVSVEAGEKGFNKEVATLSGGNERFDFNTVLSYDELTHYDISDNEKNNGSEDDSFRRLSFYNNLGLNFLDDGRADLTVLHNKTHTDLDNSVWPNYWQVDDPDRSMDADQWMTSLNISKPLTEIYTQTVKAGYNEETDTGRNDGKQEYLFTTRDYDATLQGELALLENDTVTFGYDFRRSEAENDGNYDTETRDQNAVFINNIWDYEKVLFLTLGGRYDHYSDADGKATWNTSASWQALDYTRFHGSAGAGFKVPTMNDLYWPADAWSSGNPNLKPEESRSFDVGVEQGFFENMVLADVTYFHNKVDNLIQWDEVSPFFWTPANVNKAKMEGFETSLTFTPIENLKTKTFFTYTDAVDETTGNQLARRAKYNAGLSANWDYTKRGSVYAEYTYTGNRYDDGANTRRLDAFGLVAVGTRYKLTDYFSVFANVDDLLDTYYETAAGCGTVGRLASVGAKYSF